MLGEVRARMGRRCVRNWLRGPFSRKGEREERRGKAHFMPRELPAQSQ